MINSFPLQWPQGYPRRKHQVSSAFRVNGAVARNEMLQELDRLGAKNVVISTNVATYERGGRQIPYAKRRVDDTGVAVYFTWQDEQRVIACDKYNSVDDNIRAIGLTVSALRALERHGATDILTRAFHGLKTLPETTSGTPWWDILGVRPTATKKEIREAFVVRATAAHPDTGGSKEEFRTIHVAYKQGIDASTI